VTNRNDPIAHFFRYLVVRRLHVVFSNNLKAVDDATDLPPPTVFPVLTTRVELRRGSLEFNDANQTEKPGTKKQQAGWLRRRNRATSIGIEPAVRDKGRA
jgi:hypothetical protein